MPLINTNSKEIHFKVLYCGAKGVGKKSTLFAIRSRCVPDKIDWIELNLAEPVYGLILNLGTIFKFQTFFHIYHLSHESKKDNKVLFTGSDGIIFIASLDPQDRQKNLDSLLNLENMMKEQGKDPFKTPFVLQYNKSDLKDTQSLKQMRLDFNKYNSKDFESSCLKKTGILEPLKHLCKLTLLQIKYF